METTIVIKSSTKADEAEAFKFVASLPPLASEVEEVSIAIQHCRMTGVNTCTRSGLDISIKRDLAK